MKKIISLGIASAVLALAAISASAEIIAEADNAPVVGTEFTVKILTDAPVSNFTIAVKGEGIQVVNTAGASTEGFVTAAKRDDTTVGISGASTTGFSAGSTLATITYTVTGEVGGNVSITLTDEEGLGLVTEGSFVATIEDGGNGGDVTDPGTSGDGTGTGDNSGDNSGSGSGDKTGDKDNPETGIALAVVPAVLAGAAVVVAKKRK